MINFSENFYGLPLSTWLIIAGIILVFLGMIFFSSKKSKQNKQVDNFGGNNSDPAPATIYNFNTSWCGWSTKFQPEWEEFTAAVESDPSLRHITVVDVKCDKSENEAKCKEFDVQGFPSVIIELADKVGSYKGPRTAKDLIEAARNI